MSHEEAAPAEGAAPAAPKSKMVLIAAIVAGIAVGGGSGVVVAGPMFAKKFAAQAAAAAAAAADTTGAEEKPAEEGKKEGGDKEGKGAAAPPVLTLENLVLNPAGSNAGHYLLLTIAIECKDQKGVETLTLRDAELKDLILTALGKKTVEQLSDIAQRDPIKTELIASLTERFGKSTVKQLYFPQFVIQ